MGVRKRGKKREKLDGLEEGEGRERGRKLLAKKMMRAFAGSRNKKGQGGFLTRRDRTRTRTIVCGDDGTRGKERER